MSNIHGLGSAKSGKPAKPSESEEFFGGGATSGTAVWRPTSGPMRQGNQSTSNPNRQNSPPPSAMQALVGAARQQAANENNDGIDRNIGLITIYANGFIMGNGEFREASDPRNAAFIESLKAGDVPEELEAMCRAEWGDDPDAVRVQLVDKSSETYKPKFSFAASKGQSLGSSSSSSSSSQSASFNSISASRITVDSTQPTTVVQLVLADRRRLRETFNTSNTVGQVYGHIASLSSSAPGSFEIVAGFPPKPLTEPQQTLKDAGLIGSSIQQKMSQ